MTYLLLSILFNTLLFLILKLFARYRVDNFPAIIINYTVAACFGFIINAESDVSGLPSEPWFISAVILGFAFVFMFYLIALTAQKIGVSVATVANKMALVIPVSLAVVLYNDTISITNIAGIALALVGVYLVFKKDATLKIDKRYLYLPLVIFAISGLIDTGFKYLEHHYLDEEQITYFIPVVFSVAAITGLVYCAIREGLRFNKRNIIGGTVLGVVNYFSIYFYMNTLEVDSMQSSIVFPLNNIGIVVLSTAAAFLLFKEKLSAMNWAGIVLSIIAILLISFC